MNNSGLLCRGKYCGRWVSRRVYISDRAVQYSDYDWLMRVISQENYPLTKVPSASFRPGNTRSKIGIVSSLTKRAEFRKCARAQSLSRWERRQKIITMVMAAIITTTARNDNNHRTRIDRFKGVEAPHGRESDWSLGMETSRRLMVNFFPIPSAPGWLYPTDR